MFSGRSKKVFFRGYNYMCGFHQASVANETAAAWLWIQEQSCPHKLMVNIPKVSGCVFGFPPDGTMTGTSSPSISATQSTKRAPLYGCRRWYRRWGDADLCVPRLAVRLSSR